MRLTSGTEVQAAIAWHVLGAQAGSRLGDVELRPHQREAARRARQLLDSHGGALLGDDVGLGKTYAALAVAREYQSPLFIGPASLRETWTAACRRARVVGTFVSYDALARDRAISRVHDLVVVDEAHHLRNPATKRFLAVRAACVRARVLLLSATPVQNRIADLRVVLSLFLGERAHAMSIDELGALIVRRPATDPADDERPTQDPPRWLHPDPDLDCLDAIMALPAPVTAEDEGDAGMLLRYSLARQWCSSRGALVAALRRRLARALALEDSLAQGRRPTRAELNAWLYADGAQQLALPLTASDANRPVEDLLAGVRLHVTALREFLRQLRESPDPDESRAARLRELLRANPGRRIIAFSEYTGTVETLFRLLAPTSRVAMLTRAGGRLASGRFTRAELIARFRPGARDAAVERERIDLLLSTDVLSEGVDLHDASIVVHLDLPWNPARLAQRVGRVRRIGSPEASVAVYAMAPPAPAERLLELERRLRGKLQDAGRLLPTSSPLPGIDPGPMADATGVSASLAATLAGWHGGVGSSDAVAGAVHSTRPGALACVRRAGRVILVACLDDLSDEPAIVADLASAAQQSAPAADPATVRAVAARVQRWLAQRSNTDVIDLPARRLARSRAGLLRRADAIARRAPLHSRVVLSPLLLAARRAATVPLPAGAEDVLDELARAPLDDSAWLRAVSEFASIHGRTRNDDATEILAVLLLKSAD